MWGELKFILNAFSKERLGKMLELEEGGFIQSVSRYSGKIKWRREAQRLDGGEQWVSILREVTGFTPVFNSFDFKVNCKGAQLACHANPPQFHSLRISPWAQFWMSVRLRCLTTFYRPLDLDISPPHHFSVCLSVVCLHFLTLFFFILLS